MEKFIGEIVTNMNTRGAYERAQREELKGMTARRKRLNARAFGITQDAADLFPDWKRANPRRHPEVRP